MSSSITHAAILVLAKYFPLSPIALLIGSQIPDIENPLYYIHSLIKRRHPLKAYLNCENGLMHSLIGSIFISIPLTIYLSKILDANGVNILLSAAIGVFSHILLDLPGHSKFTLFFPYVIKNNPFIFRLSMPLLERLYPYKRYEGRKNQVLHEFNWFIISHILVFIALAFYFI